MGGHRLVYLFDFFFQIEKISKGNDTWKRKEATTDNLRETASEVNATGT